MEKEFDFDKIGKRMPYKTPDAFFDEMEENIWNEVKGDLQPKAKHPSRHLRVLAGALSIAASVALVIVLYARHSQAPQQQVDGLAQVEQAFASLTPEDQAYMLQVYQDDVFINQ